MILVIHKFRFYFNVTYLQCTSICFLSFVKFMPILLTPFYSHSTTPGILRIEEKGANGFLKLVF